MFTIVNKEIIKKHMRIKYGTGRTSVVVSRAGPRLHAKRFSHDVNTSPGIRGGRAVFFRPKRDGGGHFLNTENGQSKAFVATMKSGHRSIWRRTSGSRTPIAHETSLSVPEMLNDPAVHSVIQTEAVKRFHKELDHQVNYLLNQHAGGRS